MKTWAAGEAVLASDLNANFAAVRGNLLLAHFTTLSPADSTSYYFGVLTDTASAGTGPAIRQIVVPVALTIKAWSITVKISGTLGSNEGVTFAVRVNDTTDYVLSTAITHTADGATFYGTLGSPISLNAGDKIEIKMTAPAYATNPTGLRQSVFLFY